jgi:hypothetical protein
VIKVGFLLEGWTDLIAFRILTARVLGEDVEPIDVRRRSLWPTRRHRRHRSGVLDVLALRCGGRGDRGR